MNYRQIDGNTVELKFYGYISEWWISADDFDRTIDVLEEKYKTIVVRVHCYGGSVFEGIPMQSRLARCKNAKIIFIIDGVAASMITNVMLGCGERRINPNGFVMVHEPIGNTVGGEASHKTTLGLLGKMKKNFIRDYKVVSGREASQAEQWMDGADHWFDAKEALELGLVTAIEESAVEIANETIIGKPEAKADEDYIPSFFNRFAAILNIDNNKNLPTNKDHKMKKELIEKHKLEGVTEASSDQEVLDALDKKVNSENASAKTSKTEAINALIDASEIKSGKKFEDKARASFVAVGESNGMETLKTLLATSESAAAVAPATPATPTPNAVQMISNGGGTPVAEDRKSWDFDKWQSTDPDGFQAYSKTNPTEFNAIFKAKYGYEPK